MRRRSLMVGGGAAALGLAVGPAIMPRAAFAQAMDWEITAFDKTLGDPNAPIVMIEYASFTCPHCATFHNDILPSLKADFLDTGEVLFVFRDFPLDGLALRAGMMARCIGGDAYFPVVNALFAEQETWARASDPVAALFAIGQQVGMTQADFDDCMQDRALAEEIVGLRQEGIDRYNVQSTPSFLVNGEMHAGARPVGYWENVFADTGI